MLRKRVRLLSLGGTIAMTRDVRGLANPALDAMSLMEAVPALSAIATVDGEPFANVPSPFLLPADILRLAGHLRELRREGYDGAVVTQGTDTLEETAYLLDLLIPRSDGLAVVVTGAQRNPSLVSPDGPSNLLDSVITAADPRTAQMGAVVVFCSEIHAGRDVVKTHTTRLDTFKSPETGPLGAITNGQVAWLRSPVVGESYSPDNLNAKVEVAWAGMGSTSFILDAALGSSQGIVLQAVGAGHVPPAMVPGIKRLIAAGIPVVMTSRCHAGRLLSRTYGYEGSETHLHDLGVIFGDGLPTSKARMKLLVLLGAGMSVAQIRAEFERNYY